jgi:H+-transporting ATPase
MTDEMMRDRARPSSRPNSWRIRNLTLAPISWGRSNPFHYVGVLAAGWCLLRLNPGQMRTLTLVPLVFAGQVTVYVLKEPRVTFGARVPPPSCGSPRRLIWQSWRPLRSGAC